MSSDERGPSLTVLCAISSAETWFQTMTTSPVSGKRTIAEQLPRQKPHRLRPLVLHYVPERLFAGGEALIPASSLLRQPRSQALFHVDSDNPNAVVWVRAHRAAAHDDFPGFG